MWYFNLIQISYLIFFFPSLIEQIWDAYQIYKNSSTIFKKNSFSNKQAKNLQNLNLQTRNARFIILVIIPLKSRKLQNIATNELKKLQT